jgi:hypothetical protein
MNLFDDFERTYTEYSAPQESNFAFLNRSAMPKFVRTRKLLERWFHEYPAAHQTALGTSFRSDRDSQHWGAFFEIYCHALLWHQGFTSSVQEVVDPAVNRPIDFLVQKDGISLFYLEATVAADSSQVLANQRKVWEFIDALNVLNEPNFQVGLEIERESSQNLPFNRIRSAIQRWLQTLDPNEVTEQIKGKAYEKHPQWIWDRDGWRIIFFAIPRPQEDRGMMGQTVLYHFWDARGVEGQNSLKDALEEKADRYGELQLPYMIAVDVLAIDSFGRDVGEVLFGKEVVLIDTQSEKVTLTRSPLLPNRHRSENGLWFARRGLRNRQISAVLLVDELMPWAIAHKTPLLWHNPWAEKPLDSSLWQGPQMLPDMNASPPQMRYRDGKQAFEFLHLSPDWPNDEAG